MLSAEPPAEPSHPAIVRHARYRFAPPGQGLLGADAVARQSSGYACLDGPTTRRIPDTSAHMPNDQAESTRVAEFGGTAQPARRGGLAGQLRRAGAAPAHSPKP